MLNIRSLFLLPLCFVLSSCALLDRVGDRLSTSTIISYTPVTYCSGLYDSRGTTTIGGEPVLVEEVLVFRLDEITNNQSIDVALYPGYFYVRIEDTRMATLAAQVLTNMPVPLRIAAGATLRPSETVLVALRVGEYGNSGELVSPVTTSEGTRLRVEFLPLNYDPVLRGELRPWITINRRGNRYRTVLSEPCRLEDVLALARSLR